jgi:hypothetical protein
MAAILAKQKELDADHYELWKIRTDMQRKVERHIEYGEWI